MRLLWCAVLALITTANGIAEAQQQWLRVNSPILACKSESDFNRLSQLADSDDEAGKKLLIKLYSEDRCMFFRQEDIVVVESKYEDLHKMTVRKKGDYNSYVTSIRNFKLLTEVK